jgi:SAM-dependent methyltransferase
VVTDLVTVWCPTPRVLDLGCGPGSLTKRLLARAPNATVTALDLDPVLLRLARDTFDGDDRVTVVERDLRVEGWSDNVPGAPFDAVVATRALHWLDEPILRRTYEAIATLVPSGGLFVNADRMPLEQAPPLADGVERARRVRPADGHEAMWTWKAWWDSLAREVGLEVELATRWHRFGSLATVRFTPSERWHLDALRKSGFSEAAVIWRSGNEAAIAAIRSAASRRRRDYAGRVARRLRVRY